MKAGFGLSIAAGVAALTAGGAGAQTTTAPAANPPQQPQQQPPSQQQTPPPAGTVGPRELRDFSLGGTPTRPVTPPAQGTPPATQPPAGEPSTTQPARTGPVQAPRPRVIAPTTAVSAVEAPPGPTPVGEAAETQTPDFTPTVTPLDPAPLGSTAPLPQIAPPDDEARALPLWPWLLACVAVALGAGLMFFRQRSRRELAGYGAEEIVADPVPPPAPLPRAPVTPVPVPSQRSTVSSWGGVVSTGLRPWIDLQVSPGRCIFDQTQATVEFLLKITNSGGAHARDLRISTRLFNAGPTQDEEIGAFFAYPPANGEALEAMPPIKGMEMQGSVSMPRDQLQILQAGDRQLFVPLIGFNAAYRWSGGQGQTSVSFLLGREGGGDKMAPFRADLGPRVFRGIGARELQLKVRR